MNKEDQTLEITSGTSESISITITDDEEYESAETFEVRITGVTNARFASWRNQYSRHSNHQ